MFRLALACLLAMVASADAEARADRRGARTPAIGLESVNGATLDGAQASRALLVRAAVLLDRAGISPGVIDGHGGDNFDKAIRAFRMANDLGDGTTIDQPTVARLLERDPAPALVTYEITGADVKGPWTRVIPARMEAQARLRHLGYRNAAEQFAERFHMDVDLLQTLNPGRAFDRKGETIVVAGVEDPRTDPTRAAAIAAGQGVSRKEAAEARKSVTRIAVDKKVGTLSAFDKDGGRLMFAPASIGSPEKPAPSGTLNVTRVAPNPSYTYDPKYAFKGVKAKRPFEIAAGPNNPVGSVWIALDREGYGIHGTPEPAKVGKTQSHGCIRLTNWSALRLATLVDKGVPVEFGE